MGQKARAGPAPALVMSNEVATRTILVRIYWLSAGPHRKLSQAVGVTGSQRCRGIGTYLDDAIALRVAESEQALGGYQENDENEGRPDER